MAAALPQNPQESPSLLLDIEDLGSPFFSEFEEEFRPTNLKSTMKLEEGEEQAFPSLPSDLTLDDLLFRYLLIKDVQSERIEPPDPCSGQLQTV